MKKDLLIGEFSELTGISKRMIRHFDMLGLLAPHHIDHITGYRYYSASQIQLAQKIRFLQDLGFSLKEIQDLLLNPQGTEVFLDLLKDQEVKLRNDADQKIGQLLRLKNLIDYVVIQRTNLDELPLFEAERSLQMDVYEQLKNELRQMPSPQFMTESIEETYKQLEGSVVTFVSFDIDNFLKVNENYGYDAGDKVIYRFYAIIRDCFNHILNGDSRNIFTRLGGDEFGLLIIGTPTEDIEAAANLVLAQTRIYNFASVGGPDRVTSSCGIASSTKIAHPADLRHQSSKALISAKRQGRDQVDMIAAK